MGVAQSMSAGVKYVGAEKNLQNSEVFLKDSETNDSSPSRAAGPRSASAAIKSMANSRQSFTRILQLSRLICGQMLFEEAELR